jgi:hypothetical protein
MHKGACEKNCYCSIAYKSKVQEKYKKAQDTTKDTNGISI